LHPAAPRPSAITTSRRRRVAFYSHDTLGLGHTRRNIKIAAAMVAEHPATDVLLLTGAPEATVLPLPPSTEVLTLPTLRKNLDGRYSPRVLSGPLDELLHMRSRLLETALATYNPDLLVVDKVARGVDGELDRTLHTLRGIGRARIVLGLRDVLDEPGTARREWEMSQTTEAIRELYDAVWVYGDPSVYDPVAEYRLPADVAAMVSYTGYLAGPAPECLRVRHSVSAPVSPPDRPYVLCQVGGGEDGHALARAFIRAKLPGDRHGVVLTGPHMPGPQRQRLLRETEGRADVTVHEFVPGAQEFVGRADATVSMGGYNSVCELLAAPCPALLVPRATPRAEQAVRAERLSQAGWVDVLPAAGVTPGRIGAWLSRSLQASPRPRRAIDLDGLVRIPRLAEQLQGTASPREGVSDVAV
jgi:predicted glycosyltransferase